MCSSDLRSDVAGKSLLVCGWFQSWKYTVGIESALRRHLRLLPNVSAAVHSFLDQIRPSTWKEHTFSRIGIHVRAGDVVRRKKCNFGYTLPQLPYFEQAMSRFVSEQTKGQEAGRVQFIVTSDDLQWTKTAVNFTQIVDRLNQTSSTSSSTKRQVLVDVAYSEGHDAGFDLALLSVCDGVIMSTGTYGWWGAWLANKTTIYYSNWPRTGSRLSGIFNRDDYFPPHWIPIGGPAFPCRRAGTKNKLGVKQQAPKAPVPRRRRRRGRGAKGAEIETPKSSRGGVCGGCPSPHPTKGSGERRELPSGVGAEPRRKTNSMHSDALRRLQKFT